MTVLVPMTDTDFAAFVDDAVAAYAMDKVAAGQWRADQALALARHSFAELLPQGLASPDNHLFTIRDPATAATVGALWIAVQDRAGTRIAYVYDVSVQAHHQRRGHGSRAFRALEDTVRRLGLGGIALHVFAHNTAAHALYVKLGYQATDIDMYKPVGLGRPD